MTKVLLLLSGGAVGTLLRYYFSGWAHRIYDGTFPVGTLVVNVIGSFIIGLVWGLSEQGNISSGVRTFIFIGLLGGFTTFSSFSLETMHLFRNNEIKLGLINILANNILGIAFVFAGFILAMGLIKLIK